MLVASAHASAHATSVAVCFVIWCLPHQYFPHPLVSKRLGWIQQQLQAITKHTLFNRLVTHVACVQCLDLRTCYFVRPLHCSDQSFLLRLHLLPLVIGLQKHMHTHTHVGLSHLLVPSCYRAVFLVIILNSLVLALDHHPMSPDLQLQLDLVNLAFSFFFILEVAAATLKSEECMDFAHHSCQEDSLERMDAQTCAHVYTHTNMYTRMHTHTCTHTSAHTCTPHRW
jgi:hypothetical protein